MEDNAPILNQFSEDKTEFTQQVKRRKPLAFLRMFAPLSTPTGKVQALGLAIILTMILLAVFAPVVAPFDPKANVCEPFGTPTAQNWLGCNDFGQDLLSQLLYGARVSLFVGIVVATISTCVATALALLAGYHASNQDGAAKGVGTAWIDKVIMRAVDVALSLPFLPLVIVLGVYFGASIQTQILVITLVMWAQPVRELRSQILSIRASTFVEASRAMGASSRFVGLRHILPELAPLIVPQFVRIAHNAILVEAALSFLGLGDPLQNSWGSILFHANARAAFLTGAWTYWIVPPGLAIAFTVVAFAFIGYGFDASLSPRGARKSVLPKPSGDNKNGQVTQDKDVHLAIKGLDVSYPVEGGNFMAVRNVSLSLQRGELLGLVGESGSGKSSIALAILRLLREPVDIPAGVVELNGEDLLQKTLDQMRHIRARKIALIPQSAMNALNPVLTIEEQLLERLQDTGIKAQNSKQQKAAFWMEKVGLQASHLKAYPHELSGGMRQRAVIAIALCGEPELVIADEPTTGLDVLVQESIMQLLLKLRQEMGLTIFFVTHNLQLIARHCDRLAVMHRGRIVEAGPPAMLTKAAEHPHTKALFDNLPGLYDTRRWGEGRQNVLDQAARPVLELQNVGKAFVPSNRHLSAFWKKSDAVAAVESVSLSLHKGEAVGLVGGSGAGKSTIARLILGAIRPDTGTILLDGKNWSNLSSDEISAMRRKVHMVFQDPYQSLNNRVTISNLVAEPLFIHQGGQWQDYQQKIRDALALVRLPNDDEFLNRLPISLSGGQRQRVAFARAIITKPSVIIADEPTSMLDQSIRMDVMDVMEELRAELGTAFLFITHDIALARHFCDRLIVLKDGRIVEKAETNQLIFAPNHNYTKALIAAV